MSRWVRNALILFGLLAVGSSGAVIVAPYVERFFYLLRNDPFNRVVEMLQTDPSAKVREEAAKTLATLDRRQSVGPLLAALQDQPEIREAVEQSLVGAGVPAVEPVVELLRELAERSVEGDLDLLESAMRILGEIAPAEGREIWRMLAKDRRLPESVRKRAVKLLGGLEARELVPIRAYLDSVGIRVAALEAIAESRDVDLTTFVMQEFIGDPNFRVRRQALVCIAGLAGERGEEQAQGGLLSEVGSDAATE